MKMQNLFPAGMVALAAIALVSFTTPSYADGRGGVSAESSSSSGAVGQGSAAQTQGIDFGTTTINNPKQYRNTPDVTLLTPAPTSACRDTAGAAGSIPGFGIAINGSSANDWCQNLETARMLAGTGVDGGTYAAKQYMCNADPGVAKAYEEIGMPCGQKVVTVEEKAEQMQKMDGKKVAQLLWQSGGADEAVQTASAQKVYVAPPAGEVPYANWDSFKQLRAEWQQTASLPK